MEHGWLHCYGAGRRIGVDEEQHFTIIIHINQESFVQIILLSKERPHFLVEFAMTIYSASKTVKVLLCKVF